MTNLTLDQFRESLDDIYSSVLASDSSTRTRLTAHIKIGQGAGLHFASFMVKGPGVKLETHNLAEASRRYWEIVYSNGTEAK